MALSTRFSVRTALVCMALLAVGSAFAGHWLRQRMLLERALDTAMRGGARVATYYGPDGKVEVTIDGPISEGTAAAFTKTSALTHLSISPPPDDAVSQLLLRSFVLRNRGDPATHCYVRR